MIAKKKPYSIETLDIEEPAVEEVSFANGINIYKLIFIFFIGAILGFIVESLFCIATLGHLENRSGLILGPFKPIYGFGAVLFTILLYKLRNSNSLLIFLLSAIIGGAFEIFCSLFEEYVFGVEYWEYSDSPFNIDGRTNLFYSLCWGILGLIFIKHIYPFISKIIEKIPNKFGVTLTWIIFAFLVIDISISGCAIFRYVNRVHGIEPKNFFDTFLDAQYPDEFLEKLYPTMTIL